VKGVAIAALVVSSLAPNLYWTQGGGGNSGFIIGKTGVIVVDATLTPASAKELVAEVAKVTPKPITHVILTHGDPDHVSGLAAFPAGVTVIAHEGAMSDLRALPKDRAPSRLIARTGEVMTIDGVRIAFHHWAPAHTNGDLIVYLPEQKIMFAGDLVTADADPSIRLEKRGSSEGWITSVKGLLGLRAEQIVPGHGGVRPSAEIQTRLDAAAAKRDKIAALVREGKSIDEVKAALGDPPAARGPAPLTFTDVVYQELTKRLR
jgi:cyclase